MALTRSIVGFGGLCLIVVSLTMFHLSFADQRICGEGLLKTIELVCPLGFNGYKTKRNSLSLEEDYNTSNDEDDNFALSLGILPLLSGMETNSVAKTRRRRHGIAHECCDKPCSLGELTSYCRHS